MSIRFQADADLKHAIVTGVLRQRPAIDFQGSEGMPLAGLDDRSVLELCALHGRVLVSHDVTTMESNFRIFIRTQKKSRSSPDSSNPSCRRPSNRMPDLALGSRHSKRNGKSGLSRPEFSDLFLISSFTFSYY